MDLNRLGNIENTPEPEKKKKADAYSEGYDILQCLVVALVACVLIFVFAVRNIEVIGSSMVPTLHDDDRIIISDLFYSPDAGDIVVVRTESFSQDPIVKRIIATAGQTVSIDFEEGIVYVDGIALDEPYIAELTTRPLDFSSEVTVPEGCVFVMGDNRNESRDSRDDSIGFIDEREIMGRALIRIAPLNSFGFID